MNKKVFWGILAAMSVMGCTEDNPNPDGNLPAECLNGTRQCNVMMTSVDVCVNGKWIVETPCVSPTSCDASVLQCRQPGSDTPNDKVCNEGDRQCSPDKGSIWKCVKNANQVESWSVDSFCNSGETCNAATISCEGNTAVNPDLVCTEWTRKCENGNVWTCMNNTWKETSKCGDGQTCSDATLSCVPVQAAPACTNGVVQCDTDSSRVLRCDNGAWTVQETCQGETSCDPASLSCKTGCTAGTVKCDALNRVMTCNGSEWTVKAECFAGQTCNAEKGTCDTPPECTEGDEQCNSTGTGMIICRGGKWTNGEMCDAGYQCIAGSCIPGKTCSGNGSECRNGDIISCVNGVELTTDCGVKNCILRDGKAACEAYLCDDGDIKCKNSSTSQTCINNAYVDTSCGSGYHCDNVKGCVKTICKENEKRCNNNSVETCTDNAWNVTQSCGTSKMCDSDSNQCIDIICKTGEKYCNGNTIVACQNNAYQQDKVCGDGEFCVESGTSASCVKSVCTENSYQCNGSILQICKDNAWTKSKDCGSAICNPLGTCDAIVCKEGTIKCSNSKKSVMICSGNKWVTKEQCSKTGAMCEASGSTYACVAQAPKVCDDGATCDGNTLKVCADNAYILEKTCLASETCNASKKSCDPKPECTPGAFKCSGSSLYKCNNSGFWPKSATKTCTGTEVCDATQGQCVDTAVCSNGAYYCESNKLQKCVSGQWQTEKTCNATLETCNAAGKTCDLKPVCTNGDYNCNGLTLRKCVGGQWQNQTTCSGATTCSESLKKCIECTEGDTQCSKDGKSTMVCSSGNWQTTACAASEYCSEELIKCIECEADEYRCNSNKLQSCSASNKWATLKTCNNSTEYCDASQQTCILKDVCSNGQYSCDGQTLKVCTSGQWKTSKTCTALENCDASKKSCVLKPVCTPTATRCNGNVYETCSNAGQWAVTQDCGASAICENNGVITECVEKLTLPEWCNIQGVDARAMGYGRVLMPNDVDHANISAQFACGNVESPVKSWTYTADALRNTSCSNCYANTEYMSYSMDAPAGTYACTYLFEFGPQTIACLPKTGESDGGAPIVLSDDTKLKESQTMPLTIPTASTEPPAWCHFKYLDTDNVMGYGRIYLPGATTPAQVDAMLICGDITKPAASWTHTSAAIQNLSCNDCGNNVEYMSPAMALSAGKWSCAFRFDVSGKSYVCSTNEANGTPIQLSGSTILTENESWGFTK